VYNRFSIARKYLHYYITAQNGRGHGLHSPFVFSFIKEVLNDRRSFYAYEQVEQLREALRQEKTLLEVVDFGAGSALNNKEQRSVAAITRHAAKSKKYARLLYRIVNHYGCRNIIELGTSMGISSAYMASANNFGRVITCEGSPAIAQQARHNFSRLMLTNITVLEGVFELTLRQALAQMPSVDLLFIDGNHRQQPTLDYFNTALSHLHNDSIVVFDDIHWSNGMEAAWEQVKAHEAVSETIDLFFIGLAFFRKEQKEKQHFTIRF
jgi:predicted O-methyltransferase YrrM